MLQMLRTLVTNELTGKVTFAPQSNVRLVPLVLGIT